MKPAIKMDFDLMEMTTSQGPSAHAEMKFCVTRIDNAFQKLLLTHFRHGMMIIVMINNVNFRNFC